MYKLSDLFEDYKFLQEDYNLLQTIRKQLTRELLDTGDVEDLLSHNCNYRRHIENWLANHMPETSTDLQKWSEEDVDAWLDFLIAYPALYAGKEEKLIGLFWSLDSVRKLPYKEKVAYICTHQNMVDFAADSRNEAVANTLWSLIGKYATLSQVECFQNKVDLKINDIR